MFSSVNSLNDRYSRDGISFYSHNLGSQLVTLSNKSGVMVGILLDCARVISITDSIGKQRLFVNDDYLGGITVPIDGKWNILSTEATFDGTKILRLVLEDSKDVTLEVSLSNFSLVHKLEIDPAKVKSSTLGIITHLVAEDKSTVYGASSQPILFKNGDTTTISSLSSKGALSIKGNSGDVRYKLSGFAQVNLSQGSGALILDAKKDLGSSNDKITLGHAITIC